MKESVLDIRKLMTMLPHRFPFLLVDRVIQMEDPGHKNRVGKKAVGIKNVTFNEPYFTGHFPDNPIMPGVLQIEAMAQLAGVSYYRDGDPPMEFLIASIDGGRFRRPVVPGDVLRISSEILKARGRMIQVRTECSVDGDPVAEATILAYVQPKTEGQS